GTISSDTVWETGVYYVTANLTINAGAVLTIKPGVIVKFASGVGMTINGDLVAVGEGGNEIIFTSYKDDSVGGNTNGGDADEVGVAGDWYRLWFRTGVDPAVSRLTHVEVRYGGSGSATASVFLDDAVPITDSMIRFSLSEGLRVQSATAQFSGNTIEDNTGVGISSYNNNSTYSGNTLRRNSHGLYVQLGSPAVHDNILQDNTGYGLYDRYQTVVQVPTGNTVSGNNIAMRVNFAALPGVDDGNSISGNTRNQIELWGGTLSRSVELPANVVYYQVSGTGTINTGVNVRLSPGLVW
ncbi:MAG: right-handed parallel beta-helix repeat-containing protein, partial [Gammaproteobacteria bacterium]|nr:right-handed parallel beta-helix repeat-containing protein [Gammaproteobacteria bacterium]